MTKIIDQYFLIPGYEVHLRILPDEFKADEKHISNLIDNNKFDEAKVALETAYKRWGHNDPDLIRLGTFHSFMKDGLND